MTNGVAAEWLIRHSVLNLVGSTLVGSNPVVGTTNQQLTANSTVHASKDSKRALRN